MNERTPSGAQAGKGKPSSRALHRIIPPVLFILVALILLLYWTLGRPLAEARAHLAAGNPALAAEELEDWVRLRIRPQDYEQLLSAAYLMAGNEEAARPLLARTSRRGADWRPAIPKAEAGRAFFERGLYDEFLAWDAAVKVRSEADEAKLYRAAAQLGAGRPEEARRTLADLDRDEVEAAKLEALERALMRREEGSFPLVVDRGGQAIAVWQMLNRDLVAVNADFAPLIDTSGGELTIEGRIDELGTANVIETTLDPRVQRAALEALEGYRGSLVAIDPSTHEILAIASTEGANLALEGMYEPGSIVKVLTALAAADSAWDPSSVYPLQCEGFTTIDGRQFFDWARHDAVPGMADAMAVSCNVAFAETGIELGGDALRALMDKALFDQAVDLEVLRVNLGRHVKPVDHTYMVANYAIGLEVQQVNALHVAILASMVANEGVIHPPKLVRARRSILGEAVEHGKVRGEIRVVSAAAVRAVLPGMKAVVTDPRGSGRRTAIEGLSIAMKTGTAGDAAGGGYDSVIMAFAPADDPRIAIGMIAENAGPAELAGAGIARAFLEKALQE